MNVLSVFDGHSGAMISLVKAGIKVDNYFSSEIDKHAIKASNACYQDEIRLGDVKNVSGLELGTIDILLGGSPCQSFSFAGKRKGMSTKCEIEILDLNHYLQLKSESFEFEGQSYLFWEYMRILRELQQVNPDVYFFLENVEMGEKWEHVISKAIGVKGIHINSALVSAQNRRRIYWTNIGMQPGGLFGDMESIIPQPKDRGILLKDILESEVDEKYYLSDKALNYINRDKRNLAFQMDENDSKSKCVTAVFNKQIPYNQICVEMRGRGENNEQQLEPRNDNKTNAITSVQKDNLIICHNTMPRSSKTGKGGTGPLYRSDGKTYCLDTGQTNAIEVIGCDYRTDEGIRYREGGKTGTLAARARNDESCGQLASIGSRIRRLTPLECGRLQTVPEHIIDKILLSGVSDSQIYKMFGNGWNIETIVHILKHIK